MKLKLEELIDMFDDIPYYEYIAYDKKENNFIFIDLRIMSMDEYEKITDKIDADEEERYYYLPSSYVFHNSEVIEEYINEVKNEDIQDELEDVFYGKERYRRFREILRKYRMEDDYKKFREEYLKNMAVEWCKENNIEYEE